MKEKISKSNYDEDNKIAEISYYRNLKSGFEPSDELEDWPVEEMESCLLTTRCLYSNLSKATKMKSIPKRKNPIILAAASGLL